MFLKTPKNVKKIFNNVSYKYDFFNDLFSLGLHKSWKRQLVKLANPKTGEAWGDLCCGTGWTANELSKVAVSVKAIDYSKESISNAKTRFPKGNLVFEYMNALSLTYQDESFDTVVSMEAIEHFSKSDGK